MVTDGQRLYVISRRIPGHDDDEDKKTEFWLETYEGPKKGFQFVAETPLNKNSLNERLIKEDNTQDYLRGCSFSCNGQMFLMFTLDCQVRYFSLKTGAKLAKVILG